MRTDQLEPPFRLRELLKAKGHLPAEPPKFIRDSIAVEDISGTRSKPLYQGVARQVLNTNDIEGALPRYERVSFCCENTCFIDATPELQPP